MKTNSNKPIGIFDSGVGGTSIFKEIHQLMPLEKAIYLADSKNAPYGVKPKEKIIELCFKNTDLLLSKGCKIIVVACNTATTNAIEKLRSKYKVPFIGIEPAIKPAALKTTNKCIGILATAGTLASDLFTKTSELYTQDINVIEVQGNGLVKLIEAGKVNSAETTQLLEKLLVPIIEKEADYLVLGCTHYPYLIPQLKKILPQHIKIIDSGRAVARQTKSILEKSGQLAKDQQDAPEFYTNKNPRILKEFIRGNYKVEFLDF